MSKLNIKDLVVDDANFNTGTELGNALIDKSLSKFGAGRSILLDKNNKIIAGNKTTENAVAAGFENVRVIESDGSELIAVKRTDIDLDTDRGREMALADNATAKANIAWDFDVIANFEIPAREWGVVDFENPAEDDDEFIKDFNSIKNADAVYPLIPAFDERHEVFIITCENEIDANWLRERLGMHKMRSYKKATLSKSNIISIEDLKDVL
jgi:hypothetical protein